MSDYKWNNKVVQANQFVRQSYNNLKAVEIKIFDALISCIDTSKPKTKIEITKSELANAIGMQADNNYVYVGQSLKALLNETWSFTTSEYVEYRHFLESVRWFYKEDKVEVEFHKDILPMLVDLKSNFLVYSFADLKDLKSRYSMILYKYILSYARQYKTKTIPIDMVELRKVLNLKNKYKVFKEFRRNVLEVFQTEVNKSTTLPFLVFYSKKVSSRKVEQIIFTIRPRTSRAEHLFSDVVNPIKWDRQENSLLNLGKSEQEINAHEADIIANQTIEENIEQAQAISERENQSSEDPFNF